MKPEFIERLNQINRKFYSAFAASFSEARSELGREVQAILPYIADGARVLDIGCGNGRVAALLARHRRAVTYVGIDSSSELIARCQSQVAGKSQSMVFRVVDITQPGWPSSLTRFAAREGIGGFDCVLMLAVLHHIPGGQARARLMRQVRELLGPQGCAIVSTWQFMDNERMRKKIVPWSSVGIDERELEPGDALLSWKRGGVGLRYCHWIGEQEMRALAEQAGLNVVGVFRAGGREGNLSLYAVLSP